MSTSSEALNAMSGMEAETILEQGSLGVIVTSEIRQQLDAAARRPRDLEKFKETVGRLAVVDEETAKSMFYSIPRAGSRIEGGTIELAELCWQNLGNVRIGSDIVEVQDTVIIARGVAHDLETNTAIMSTVRRRIMSDGERYSDDLINVSCNAGTAFARRNAMFGLIPRSTIRAFWQMAKAMAVGTLAELPERRKKMVEFFGGIGVTVDQILALLKRPELQQVTMGDLGELISLSHSIKTGAVQVEQVFENAGTASKGTTLTPDKPKPKRKRAKTKKGGDDGDTSKSDANRDAAQGDTEPIIQGIAAVTDAGSFDQERLEADQAHDDANQIDAKPKAKPKKQSLTKLKPLIEQTASYTQWASIMNRLAEEDLHDSGECHALEMMLVDQLETLADHGDKEAQEMLPKYREVIAQTQV